MKNRFLLIFFLFACNSISAQVECFQGFQDKVKKTWEDTKKAVDAIVMGWYSVDPNEIVGPQGYDTLRWVGRDAVLDYTIYFENDPEFATAAAQMVDVRFDFKDKGLMKNFGIGDYSFANMSFPVSRKSNAYQNRVDLKDSLGYFVDLIAGLDVVNRQGFWTFTTIDPATGFAPWQADWGMLPVNDSTHVGEGFVTFSMTPAVDMKTGDVIEVTARIVFDANDTIATNTWKNTVDAGLPVSKVVAKATKADKKNYRLSFVAEDDKGGSGVRHIQLFMANSNGIYEEIACCAIDSVLEFPVEDGRTYQLYTLAVDNAGNREADKTTPDVVLNFNVPPTDIVLSDTVFRDDLQPGGFVGRLTTVDSDDEGGYTYELVEGEGALHNDWFMINGDELQIKESFKCAEDSLFKVRISTTDKGKATFAKSFNLLLERVLERPQPDTLAVTVCEGESFEFYGSYYEESGVYTYFTDNEFMCDSVHVLLLTVLPPPEEPVITVRGTHTLVSSAANGNQWYRADGTAVEGAVEQEFTPEESGVYYVETSNGVCSAVPSRMYEVRLTDYVDYELALAEGWNWVSTNIADGQERSVKGYIAAFEHSVSEVNDGDKVLYPSGDSDDLLYPELSYRLLMNQAAVCRKSGVGFAPESVAIPLKAGWNRVGYVPAGEMPLSVALENLKPVENDVVKSLDKFAIYAGGKWHGTLERMRPGEGYMYFSSAKNEFCYPVTRVFEVEESAVANSHARNSAAVWNCDMHKYADNMTLVASLYQDNVVVPDGVFTVAAFVGSECRGVGTYIDGLLYMTIHGTLSAHEKLSFKAVNNITGNVFDVVASMEFDGMHYGNCNEPYRLDIFNDVSVGATASVYFAIYPNPLRDVMYITGENISVDRINILTTDGEVVLVSDGYSSDGVAVASLAPGVYVVAVSTVDGAYYYKKVIKL